MHADLIALIAVAMMITKNKSTELVRSSKLDLCVCVCVWRTLVFIVIWENTENHSYV